MDARQVFVCSTAGKQALDSELAEWLYVCGLGMRMALPGTDADAENATEYCLR